jgi:hypothetical protein
LVDEYFGKHLFVSRGPYTHHGIGDGYGGVIHYSGFADSLKSGPICRTTLERFAGGQSIRIREYRCPKYTANDAVKRAKSRIGEDAYCLIGNNCEHFVEWCITGDHSSRQADRGVACASSVGAAVSAKGAVAAVSVAGSVSGLSGAGIMSGLAYVGAAVGGGAVAGMAIVGGAPGAATAAILNKTMLRDAHGLSLNERDARRTARTATYAGAAIGSAGGIAAVSVTGAVAGLSGAGIASGLAAVGGIVGGGMAAGTAVIAVAPVAAAVALGVGLYKGRQWLAAKQESGSESAG